MILRCSMNWPLPFSSITWEACFHLRRGHEEMREACAIWKWQVLQGFSLVDKCNGPYVSQTVMTMWLPAFSEKNSWNYQLTGLDWCQYWFFVLNRWFMCIWCRIEICHLWVSWEKNHLWVDQVHQLATLDLLPKLKWDRSKGSREGLFWVTYVMCQ